MNALKKSIFGELRNQYPEFGDVPDDKMDRIIFHHRDGLRLTREGFLKLRKIFTIYSFTLPEYMKSRHNQAMSKMVYPYFFIKKTLFLFSEMDAVTIKLSGGIEQFLENCYQIDR